MVVDWMDDRWQDNGWIDEWVQLGANPLLFVVESMPFRVFLVNWSMPLLRTSLSTG